MVKLGELPVEIRAAILSEVDTRADVNSAKRSTRFFEEALMESEGMVLEAVCMREASMMLSSADVEKVYATLYDFWEKTRATMEEDEEDVQARLYGLALWHVAARGTAATTTLLQLATEASTMYANKGWKRDAVTILEQPWNEKVMAGAQMGPWEAVAGGHLARAYVGVDRREEAGLVLDECWRWRQSWAEMPIRTLEVAEAFELMNRKEAAAGVLDLCDISKATEENLRVAKKLVQLFDDMGEEEKARRARGALKTLEQEMYGRRMRKDGIFT